MNKEIIDLEDAMDRVQDDMELLLELFDIFEEDFKVKRKQIDQALTKGDAESVRNIAHSLKGASGNISAKRLQALLLFMEKTAVEGSLEPIKERLSELDEEFRQYKSEAGRIKDEYGIL